MRYFWHHSRESLHFFVLPFRRKSRETLNAGWSPSSWRFFGGRHHTECRICPPRPPSSCVWPENGNNEVQTFAKNGDVERFAKGKIRYQLTMAAVDRKRKIAKDSWAQKHINKSRNLDRNNVHVYHATSHILGRKWSTRPVPSHPNGGRRRHGPFEWHLLFHAPGPRKWRGEPRKVNWQKTGEKNKTKGRVNNQQSWLRFETFGKWTWICVATLGGPRKLFEDEGKVSL